MAVWFREWMCVGMCAGGHLGVCLPCLCILGLFECHILWANCTSPKQTLKA